MPAFVLRQVALTEFVEVVEIGESANRVRVTHVCHGIRPLSSASRQYPVSIATDVGPFSLRSVCGWPGGMQTTSPGHPDADRPLRAIQVVCIRMARRGRLHPDGPERSVCIRMARRGCLHPDGQRRKVGAIGVSVGLGWTPWSAARTLVRGSSVYRRRWPRSRFSKKKKRCAQAETVGGCARVHECLVIFDKAEGRFNNKFQTKI